MTQQLPRSTLFPYTTLFRSQRYFLDVALLYVGHKLAVTWLLLAGAKLRRSEEHTSELQSRGHLVCRLLLEKKKNDLGYNYLDATVSGGDVRAKAASLSIMVL